MFVIIFVLGSDEAEARAPPTSARRRSVRASPALTTLCVIFVHDGNTVEAYRRGKTPRARDTSDGPSVYIHLKTIEIHGGWVRDNRNRVFGGGGHQTTVRGSIL